MRYLLLLLLLLPFAAAEPCTFSNTPILEVAPLNATVPNGGLVSGSVRVTNDLNVTIGVSRVDGHAISRQGDSWSVRVNTSLERLRYLFFAVSDDGCAATKLASLQILHPPNAVKLSPVSESVVGQEGRAIRFSVNSSLPGSWSLDRASVVGDHEYLYLPNHNDAGEHRIEFTVTDERGLSTILGWNVTVQNINRPPIQIAQIKGVSLPINGSVTANLSAYFIDPDGSPLIYHHEEHPLAEGAFVDQGEISLTYFREEVEVQALAPGKVFLTFVATDAGGLTAVSNEVNFVVLNASIGTRDSYCGDTICFPPETCRSCAQDCGSCVDECVPEWDCTVWGTCTPGGYRYRTCTVLTACENMTEPAQAEECDYRPSCNDGIRNGNETGIDCGGPCLACPSCVDGLLNQGEERVDCGGPCAACPTCTDGVSNQNESAVDCGGPCAACGSGLSCRADSDCISENCEKGVCVSPSCDDGVRNQEEENVDCGGPCLACPSCVDGLLNQGEERVDCGGPCLACPSCSDGIVNQDERFADCGGSCAPCTFADYSPLLTRIFLWTLFSFLVLTMLYLLRVITTSRLIFLVRNRKTIHFFYEDPPTYALVRFWNALVRHLRLQNYDNQRMHVDAAYHELAAMKYQVPEQQLRKQAVTRLRELYTRLLGLPPGFEYQVLVVTIARGSYPFPIKVILLRNTKILYLVEMTKLYGDATFAVDDLLRAMEHLRKAF